MGQKSKIAKFLGVKKAQVKYEQEENKSASSKSMMKKEAIHVKLPLPKITLKSFSGNPIEWLFITAVCVIFLIKLRWPKNKSLYTLLISLMYAVFR